MDLFSEKGYNPFFRFDVSGVIMEMKRRKPTLGDEPPVVFKESREMRDNLEINLAIILEV